MNAKTKKYKEKFNKNKVCRLSFPKINYYKRGRKILKINSRKMLNKSSEIGENVNDGDYGDTTTFDLGYEDVDSVS